jgi:Fe-S cluster assembly protein SufD
MAVAFAERLREEHRAALGAARAPDDARMRALDALAAVGLPTARDDRWKYANLRALEKMRLVPAGVSRDTAIDRALPQRIEGFPRIVFVDGLYDAARSDAPGAGVTFESLRAPGVPRGLAMSADAGDARFALLNIAFAVDGARITVERNAARTQLEVVFVATADGAAAASYPRIELTLAAQADLELIERHVSAGDVASFVNAAADIVIGESARLTHYRLQRTNTRSLCIDTASVEVGRDAAYQLRAVALGAASARSTSLIRLAGPGARTSVHAATVTDRQQVLDSFVRIEHAAPGTTTDEVFRGVAGPRSRVAFNGTVVVQPNARGADSKQSLRGLLAGPEAEIDARPQLEIYTDEVRCTHGATVGTLDEDMLFYLLSRGIDRETARGLLEWAFLEDVLARIEVRDLRRAIESLVVARLGGVNPLEEID